MERTLKRINEFEDVTEEEFQTLDNKCNYIIEVCRRNSNHDCSVDNWYAVLDFFVEFVQNKLDKRNPH